MINKKLKLLVLLLSINFIFSTFLFRYAPIVQSWEITGNGVCNAPEDQIVPSIVATSDGGVIIVWMDSRNLVDTDLYAQKLDSFGNTEWTINGVPICTASAHQSSPEVCTDGAGGAIVVWSDWRPSPDYDLYAQKIDSSGNIVWDSNGVVICNATSKQMNFRICSDGVGGAIVVWQDDRPGTNIFDIYAQRINQDGDTLWDDNGTIVCDAADDQNFPNLICNPAGKIFFTWADSRLGASNINIYAQMFNLTGDPEWTHNGMGVCNVAGEQNFPNIINAGGNAIITWIDFRNDAVGDIYAQRIDSSGTIWWGSGMGTPICTANDSQINPQICSDMDSGAIITWEDRRSTLHHDIYAQRINWTGDIQWGPNGTAICTANYEQQGPIPISDGASGAIIVWTDHRSNSYWNVYAQRILADSTTVWGTNGMAVDPVSNKDQLYQNLALLETGVAIMTWSDDRSTGGQDIWAQYMVDTTAPTSTSPNDASYQQGSTATITWTLYDNVGGGYYKVTSGIPEEIGLTEVVPWTEWDHEDTAVAPIDTSTLGEFFYRIEFNDSRGNIGFFDTVFINITEGPPPGGPDWGPIIITASSIAGAGIVATGIFIVIKRRKK
ncbi:MAG: hypothetical protein ACFE9Z_15375 [Promethearchaeota archaeon]